MIKIISTKCLFSKFRPIVIKNIVQKCRFMPMSTTAIDMKADGLLKSSLEQVKDASKKENGKLTTILNNLKGLIFKTSIDSNVPGEHTSTNEIKETANSTQVETSKKRPSEDDSTPKPKKKGKAPAVDNVPKDVGRLDFRVGHIIAVEKHANADSLYVEQIEIGEDKPRTAVSGLVKFMPAEDLLNKMVVVLCNLKPAKVRGVTSYAMVMCAFSPEKVEVLTPPQGSQPGDLVEFEGFERKPDSVLNPKKKVFETCAPDLKTDGDLNATYKGVAFVVPGKGSVKVESLVNVQIK